MPIFVYQCVNGHDTEELRRTDDRDAPADCAECGQPAARTMSAHYRQPDGLYSHDPNLGDEAKFQRNLEGIDRLKAKIGAQKDANHPRSGY